MAAPVPLAARGAACPGAPASSAGVSGALGGRGELQLEVPGAGSRLPRPVLDPTLFARLRVLERRRAERSGRPFGLLGLRFPARFDPGSPGGRAVLDVLDRATRDTDLLGWLEPPRVLGLLLTELGEPGRSLAAAVPSSPGEGREVLGAADTSGHRADSPAQADGAGTGGGEYGGARERATAVAARVLAAVARLDPALAAALTLDLRVYPGPVEADPPADAAPPGLPASDPPATATAGSATRRPEGTPGRATSDRPVAGVLPPDPAGGAAPGEASSGDACETAGPCPRAPSLPPVDRLLFPDLAVPRPGERLKRALDVAGSCLLLAAAAPLFGLIAALVRLTSRGPVLFRQVRVGHLGRPFVMLKFRTMYAGTDETPHRQYVRRLIREGQAAARGLYKLPSDPRVTPLGRLLRKTSLDELPQLWNVLRGDMSLVGPRPPLPYELAEYEPWHRRRVLEARPGLTGLWQVRGRSRTTFDEMVRLDLRYARTRSLWTDLRILLATPGAVLSGKGAC